MSYNMASPEVDASIFEPSFPVEGKLDEVDVTQLFDWESIFEAYEIPGGEQVAVYVFLSEPNEDFDQSRLDGPDMLAHLAAEEAEGFIAYQPIAKSSFCIWESPEHARAAIRSNEHQEAAKLAKDAYDSFRLVGQYATRTADGIEFAEF